MATGLFAALGRGSGGSPNAFVAVCWIAGLGQLASILPWLHGPLRGIAQMVHWMKSYIIINNCVISYSDYKYNGLVA